jgi:membrane protein DedA with SNARE-associated domain
VFAWLLLGSLGAPLPEDVALLTAGVLVHHGAVSPVVALLVTYVGVIAGDLTLFFLARRYGTRLPFVDRLLSPPRRRRLEEAYDRHGGRIVFFARYFGGLRAAVYVLAGIHKMRPRRFVAFDAAAAAISVPVMVAIGYLGALHIDLVLEGLATARHYLILGVLVIAVGVLVGRYLHRWVAKQRA